MGKTIVHGFDENGKIIAEHIPTPELITRLIADLPGMCVADVLHRLEEIRVSSERDERVRKTYVSALKEKNRKERESSSEIL